jgi:hypothetical protein
MTTAGAWAATGLPTGLTINTTTGVISGTPTVDGVYTLELTVKDVNGLFDTELMTITVVTKPVITTVSPLDQQIVGVQIVPEAQTSIRGTAIIPATGAWSVSAGTLPAGLTLNPDTGEITGTPTEGGDYSFTVKLTDAAGEFATKVETMRVLAGPEITTTPQSYMINLDEPWSLTQTAVKGTGNLLAASAWTFTALPEGLTANLTTGVISGFPKAIGETDVTVTVIDVNGLSDTTVIKIKVIEANSVTVNTCVVGDSRKATLYTSGNVEIEIGYDLTGDFSKRILTILANMEASLLIRNAEVDAFLKSTDITTDIAGIEYSGS